jgi:hypothetical protein
VVHSLVTARARQVGDLATLRAQAPGFEAYGAAQGVPSVSAEGAVYWLAAGEPAAADRLLHQLVGPGLQAIPRDVDFLLTVTSLVHVAAALGRPEVLTQSVPLLTPYAGRGVINAGAVTFHGVVDDYLYQAEQALGRPEATRWRGNAATAYDRIGATWWRRQLDRVATVHIGAADGAPSVLHFHPDAVGAWVVGPRDHTSVLPDWRGLHYVRELLRQPGVDIDAGDLATPGTVVTTNTDELLDREALAAYRHRLRQIDAELDEAMAWTNQGRLDRLHAERDSLLEQVRTATGLGGRRRRFGSTDERARVAVRKAIAATIQRLEQHDPALARLLRDTIRTGARCCYEPDPARPVSWLLDPDPAG